MEAPPDAQSPSHAPPADSAQPRSLSPARSEVESPLTADVHPIVVTHRMVRLAQWFVLLMAGLTFWVYWTVGATVHMPIHPGFEGSLFRQPPAQIVICLLAAAVLYALSCFVAAATVGRWWFYASGLIASIGLAAWAFRGGASRFVYTSGPSGSSILWSLALETVAFGAVVAGGWVLVLSRFDPLRRNATSEEGAVQGLGLNLTVLQAVATQAAFAAVGVVVFVPTDARGQAFFGVLAAAFVATALAQHFYRDERIARWYWLGPILLGVAGYALCAVMGVGADASQTGRLAGPLAALGRPLPLDYVTAGVIGSILGYWIGSEHHLTPTAESEWVTPADANGSRGAVARSGLSVSPPVNR